MCVLTYYSVEEGAFHRPEKFAANKIDMRGSFVVPHNNNKVVEPATIPTIGKPPSLRAVQQKQKSGRKNPNNASVSFSRCLFKKKKNLSACFP